MTDYGVVGHDTINISGDYQNTTYYIRDVNSSTESSCFTEGAEIVDGIKSASITYESDGLYDEQFSFIIKYKEIEVANIPIYIHG